MRKTHQHPPIGRNPPRRDGFGSDSMVGWTNSARNWSVNLLRDQGSRIQGHAKAADGTPLVKGRKVTGFTNTEEAAVQLTKVVPFLVEDMLTSNGGLYSKGADWQSYVVIDGKLITGQNPASSAEAARAALAQWQGA